MEKNKGENNFASTPYQGHFGINAFHGYRPSDLIEEVRKYLEWETNELFSAGLRWNRTLSPASGQFSWNIVENQKGKYDFRYSDTLVEVTQEKGISILALIMPFASWDQQRKSRQIKGVTLSSFGKPRDMNAWRDFLSRIVERYNGDGMKDMPNLRRPIKYWEIGNEPEVLMDSVEDFIETLEVSKETIKAVDPKAKVLPGGAAPIFHPLTGQPSENTIQFWDDFFESGGGDLVDIFNIHYTCPEPAPHISEFIKEWNKILKKHGKAYQEMWLTEAFGTYSSSFERHGRKYPEKSELDQVVAWVDNSCYALTHGITKLFWTIFYFDAPKESWFEASSFIKRDKTRKLIFTTQKILTSKIDNFSSASEIGKNQYEFIVKGRRVYVVWGIGKIPHKISDDILVTDIYGKEKRMKAKELELGESPLFVEMIEEY